MYVFFLARASGHFYTMGNDNASVQPVLTLADKELVEQMISTFWILFKTETGGVLPPGAFPPSRQGPVRATRERHVTVHSWCGWHHLSDRGEPCPYDFDSLRFRRFVLLEAMGPALSLRFRRSVLLEAMGRPHLQLMRKGVQKREKGRWISRG